ncbi:DUF4347 domain-containing protein, partial [Microcoleus sp. FACHB-68]|uniref:DUF4347 domain-containing protein n=1 Tax=Microcoleus sp. FACHB-68 TaxID=2692826 RepID=UPI0016866F68|nr:DUF4347 domain-containing protein [Microcoleus sp. FACHB-68]
MPADEFAQLTLGITSLNLPCLFSDSNSHSLASSLILPADKALEKLPSAKRIPKKHLKGYLTVNKQIIFIDSSVENYQSLIQGADANAEIVVLDANRSGIAQISETLLQQQDVEAVHIVSHGSAGSLRLGCDILNRESLESFSSQIEQWRKALTEDADILLYGCDVAAGEVGETFIQRLSQITGTDVAASTDKTGNAARGGDWELEKTTGAIETSLAFSSETITTYEGIFSQEAEYAWGRQLGGSGNDVGYSISVDSSGNVYTTGSFNGTADFDPGPSTLNLTSAGGDNIFVSKLNASGTLVWAKQLGGGNGSGRGIATDSSGNVYTTGSFNGTVDFNPDTGTLNLASIGDDSFISKLNADGSLAWARQLGGSGNAYGRSIAVDSSGNVYTTGYFNGTTDFDPGTGTSNLTSGSNDIFVSKLNADGSFAWAKQLGGSIGDFGYSIAVDSSGNVYIASAFTGTVDFDPGAGTFNLTSNSGSPDAFILKLNADGSFAWVKQMGGSSWDIPYSITVDSSGNVYTTGSFSGTADFDPGAGTLNLTSAGGDNIFVNKLDTNGSLLWAKQLGGSGNAYGRDIAVDSSGNVYTTGDFTGSADFDPGTGTVNLTSGGGKDIFLSRLDSSGNFLSAKQLGGSGDDGGLSVAVDSTSNVYTTGNFKNTVDFDPGTGTVNLTSAGVDDIFISKLNAAVAPTVSLTSASAATVNAPFTVTATFSEAVTGFTAADLTLSNGAVSNFAGSGTTYTFTVTPTAQGPVSVSVPGAVATDAAGNNNTAATALTRTFDSLAPSVSLTSAAGTTVNAP